MKEPGILYKEQYKALLYEASENVRDYAIIMTFLQTGIRLSELVNLRVDDVDLESAKFRGEPLSKATCSVMLGA